MATFPAFELLRKHEIAILCRITLLTLDHTLCLRDHSFDLWKACAKNDLSEAYEAYADGFD